MTESVGWAGRQGRPARDDSCEWSCPKSLCFWCPERFPVTVVLRGKGCLDESALASQAPGHMHHPAAFTGAGTLLLAPIPTPHLPLPCLVHRALTLQLRCPGSPLGWPLAGGEGQASHSISGPQYCQPASSHRDIPACPPPQPPPPPLPSSSFPTRDTGGRHQSPAGFPLLLGFSDPPSPLEPYHHSVPSVLNRVAPSCWSQKRPPYTRRLVSAWRFCRVTSLEVQTQVLGTKSLSLTLL